jgi:hypothetical protein
MYKQKTYTPSKRSPSTKSSEFITFSFKYLYKNDKFGYTYFEKNSTKQSGPIMTALFERLLQLSTLTHTGLYDLSRKHGKEKLPIGELRDGINAYIKKVIPNTDKAIILRFDSQRRRIIGYFEGNTLQIIAFDFDLTAYRHG